MNTNSVKSASNEIQTGAVNGWLMLMVGHPMVRLYLGLYPR